MSSRDALSAALAALLSPMLFLSSAHDLYLRNQDELDGKIWVLLPFWLLAGFAWLLGTLLLFAAARGRGQRSAWVSLLWGPALLLMWLARSLPWQAYFARWLLDTWLGAAAALLCFAIAVAGISRRWPPSRACPWLALVATVLTVGETARLATSLKSDSDLPTPGGLHTDLSSTAPGNARRAGNPALANVYHVVLDALSRSLLESAKPEGMDASLEGFVLFDDFQTPCAATVQNFRIILGGQPNCCPQSDPAGGARPGRFALPEMLRSRGYVVEAYAPRYPDGEWAEQYDLFVPHDLSISTVERVRLERDHELLFRRMWAVAFVPDPLLGVVERIPHVAVQREPLRELRTKQLAAYASAPISRRGFEQFLEEEPGRPARGRYVMIHLWIPHGPYLLRGDCSFGAASDDYTDRLQQTRCGLRSVMELLDMLRAADRLAESTVIVQGDHGPGGVFREGRLVGDEATRLHTAFFIKPPLSTGPLRTTSFPMSQCDVAPTIADVLELGRFDAHQGRSMWDELQKWSSTPR